MDNLNTHKPASLYKRYPPKEAGRITKNLRYIIHQSMGADWISQK